MDYKQCIILPQRNSYESSMIKLYYAFLYPHVKYCLEIWGVLINLI